MKRRYDLLRTCWLDHVPVPPQEDFEVDIEIGEAWVRRGWAVPSGEKRAASARPGKPPPGRSRRRKGG